MANYIVPVLSTFEWQQGVISKINDPPANPSNADRYIVASSPTGVWIGHANEIVTYNGGWEFLAPFEGICIFVRDINRLLQYTTKWEGLVAAGKDPVSSFSSGQTLTMDQSGETITCTSSSIETFYLPSVDASDVGAWFRFVKLGSGNLIIEAADLDKIADSGAGDTIYNDDPLQTYATLTVVLASATQWVITEGHGTWTTTD